MMKSAVVRWALGAVLLTAMLGIVREKPWRATPQGVNDVREALAVGFLPVTCHLTCPVTAYTSETSRSTRFDSQRFTDFPTVVETIKSGRLEDRKSTRLNSSHSQQSRMPSSA